MDLSKLTYTKSSSFTEPVPQKNTQKSKKKKIRNQKISDFPNVSSAYKKTEGVLSTKLVFVLSGGEKREKNFLLELINPHKSHSLKVLFMTKEKQGLMPYQMQEKWQEIKKNGKFVIESQTYHLNDMDKVFLLSDVDEFYDQLELILKNNIDNQGQWIISNPCIEIWLYYCFKNNPEVDLNELKNLGAEKKSQKLKDLGPLLVSGGLNPRKAFEEMTMGIEHSKAHYNTYANGIPILFATQMHQMAQYLVDTLNKNNEEFFKLLKEKKEFRESMKKSNEC